MAAPRRPVDHLRLQRGCEFLWQCGPRYLAHFLAQMTFGLAERAALLDRLDQWRRDIDPARARAGCYDHPALEWRMLANACEPVMRATTPPPRLQLIAGTPRPRRAAHDGNDGAA
jgi:hypothetical protein